MSVFRVRLAAFSSETGLLIRFFNAAVVALCMSASALAQNAPETNDVQRLLRAGQLDQALQKADAYLATKPRDAQMRFLKALILTEQKRTPEAISLFQKLSEDFPELPEPHNNLAVLYAGTGQYDKARAALEMAIRTDPRYATAYENLGDVYAKLAGEAYGRALQLDSSNNTAYPKLSLLRDLTGSPNTANRPVATPPIIATPTVPVTTAPAANPPVAPKPVTINQPVPATPLSTTPVAKLEPAKTEPHKIEAPKVEPKSKPEPAPVTINQSEEVLKVVRQWAADWSKKDINSYLAAYARDFKPAGGLTRAQWEAERRTRITGRGKIRVEISQPTVSIIGDTAKVNFRQRYRSSNYTNTTRKTLSLSRQNGQWLIVSEVAGD